MMPISWSLDDYPHFEFMRYEHQILPGLMNVNLVCENWIDDFTYMQQHYEWGIVTYTFHPHVIGRGHRMMMLDKLIRALQRGGATFLAMEDAVAEYRGKYPEGRSEHPR